MGYDAQGSHCRSSSSHVDQHEHFKEQNQSLENDLQDQVQLLFRLQDQQVQHVDNTQTDQKAQGSGRGRTDRHDQHEQKLPEIFKSSIGQSPVRKREILELCILRHVFVVDGPDYLVDVWTQGHFGHRDVRIVFGAALEISAEGSPGHFFLVEGELESDGFIIFEVEFWVIAFIEYFSEYEEGIEGVDDNDDKGDEAGEGVDARVELEGFDLQDRKVEEGEVADPHDEVHVDELESFLHELADVAYVLLDGRAGTAATLVVLGKDQHQDVGTDEADHHQEDRQVRRQESRSVLDCCQSTTR